MNNKERGLLTVREAARMLGVDDRTIYRFLWEKKIKAQKRRGTRWRIPASTLRALQNKRIKRGHKAQGNLPIRKGLPKATA